MQKIKKCSFIGILEVEDNRVLTDLIYSSCCTARLSLVVVATRLPKAIATTTSLTPWAQIDLTFFEEV